MIALVHIVERLARAWRGVAPTDRGPLEWWLRAAAEALEEARENRAALAWSREHGECPCESPVEWVTLEHWPSCPYHPSRRPTLHSRPGLPDLPF